MDPQNQPITPMPVNENKGFFQKYKLTLISILIIVLAAIPLLLLSNTASKQKIPQQVTSTTNPSPTSAPLTSSNADQTLNQADTNLQSTLNQADTDLQTQSQIDSSQDSTTGL